MGNKKQISIGALIVVILLVLFRTFMGTNELSDSGQTVQQLQTESGVAASTGGQETAEPSQGGQETAKPSQGEQETVEPSQEEQEVSSDNETADEINTEQEIAGADGQEQEDVRENGTADLNSAQNRETAEVFGAQLTFRNSKLLNEHYQKHGIEMGFSSAAEYEAAAAAVVENPNALHKTEAEDGDDVYYVESTNEFVIVSTDGYLRTYFYPNAGIKYFNRQ